MSEQKTPVASLKRRKHMSTWVGVTQKYTNVINIDDYWILYNIKINKSYIGHHIALAIVPSWGE